MTARRAKAAAMPMTNNAAFNATLVLIVDDNRGFRTMLGNLVRAHGFRTAECASGEEAIVTYQQLRPDVVLMDLRLKSMNGLVATEKIVALDESARVIIVTSFDDPALRKAALKAGASGYSSKDNLAELIGLLSL